VAEYLQDVRGRRRPSGVTVVDILCQWN